MRARNLLKRYLNPDRERLIDNNVHSDIGRKALKLVFIDGKTLNDASKIMGMVYSTFTDNFYHKWLPELFYNFGEDE